MIALTKFRDNVDHKGEKKVDENVETKSLFSRVCQVFCVSYKKKFIGEGNLPFCTIEHFYELLC